MHKAKSQAEALSATRRHEAHSLATMLETKVADSFPNLTGEIFGFIHRLRQISRETSQRLRDDILNMLCAGAVSLSDMTEELNYSKQSVSATLDALATLGMARKTSERAGGVWERVTLRHQDLGHSDTLRQNELC